MKKLKSFISKSKARVLSLIATLTVIIGTATLVGAEPTATPAETLTLNFSIDEMFTWAQVILDALMPIVYVTMGVALGFLIIRALKSAFN